MEFVHSLEVVKPLKQFPNWMTNFQWRVDSNNQRQMRLGILFCDWIWKGARSDGLDKVIGTHTTNGRKRWVWEQSKNCLEGSPNLCLTWVLHARRRSYYYSRLYVCMCVCVRVPEWIIGQVGFNVWPGQITRPIITGYNVIVGKMSNFPNWTFFGGGGNKIEGLRVSRDEDVSTMLVVVWWW